jgi:hypothetical protein
MTQICLLRELEPVRQGSGWGFQIPANSLCLRDYTGSATLKRPLNDRVPWF